MNFNIPKGTFGLRPARIIGNDFRHYSAIKAPEGMESIVWAEGALNRIRICGIGPEYKDTNFCIDFLDGNYDIIGEICVSKNAFYYALRLWKSTWIKGEQLTVAIQK